MGGAVGLKGTDDVLERALTLGAVPKSSERARRALATFSAMGSSLVTWPGLMGENAALSAGLAPMVLGKPPGEVTTAADTRRAAAALVAYGLDLLLFAGGDGDGPRHRRRRRHQPADPRHPDRCEDALRRVRDRAGGGGAIGEPVPR